MRVIFRGQMPSLKVKGCDSMKKLIWFVLILATLLLTVACGSEAATTAPTTSIWDSPATWVPESSVITSTEAETTPVPQTTVTTEPKLVVVHPESYEAIGVSAFSCKIGALYDSSSQYDAEKTLENSEVIDGDDVPLALRETGLNETSSEEAYIAYAKKLLSAYVGKEYGIETLWVGTKSTVKEGGFFVENEKSGFISVKDRADEAVVFYDFIFYRGNASRFPRAKVSVRSDGKLLELWIYKELYMDRFGEIYLYNTALTNAVNALQHENQTKKTTSVIMGKTHLYLMVDIDYERYLVDFDEEGNMIPVLDDMGNPVVDEHLSNTYYILLAELVPAVE